LSPAQKVSAADHHHQKSHSMNDLLSLNNQAPTEVKHAASSNDLI